MQVRIWILESECDGDDNQELPITLSIGPGKLASAWALGLRLEANKADKKDGVLERRLQ